MRDVGAVDAAVGVGEDRRAEAVRHRAGADGVHVDLRLEELRHPPLEPLRVRIAAVRRGVVRVRFDDRPQDLRRGARDVVAVEVLLHAAPPEWQGWRDRARRAQRPSTGAHHASLRMIGERAERPQRPGPVARSGGPVGASGMRRRGRRAGRRRGASAPDGSSRAPNVSPSRLTSSPFLPADQHPGEAEERDLDPGAARREPHRGAAGQEVLADRGRREVEAQLGDGARDEGGERVAVRAPATCGSSRGRGTRARRPRRGRSGRPRRRRARRPGGPGRLPNQ